MQSYLYAQTLSAHLNVRHQPSLQAPKWNSPWPKGRIAVVMQYDDDWYQTSYRGEAAYVASPYLTILADPVPDDIPARMICIAAAEEGRANPRYFNGYTGPWCHRFADWLAMHAGQPRHKIPNTANCGQGIVWFATSPFSGGFSFASEAHLTRIRRAYRTVRDTNAVLVEACHPVPGDYVYFRWKSAKASVNVSHVGIVESCNREMIHTWEGNASGRVARRCYALSDPQIVGYGHPLYS